MERVPARIRIFSVHFRGEVARLVTHHRKRPAAVASIQPGGKSFAALCGGGWNEAGARGGAANDPERGNFPRGTFGI